MIKVCNLASGSKGNSTYVETDKHKLLLDSGKNIKYITDRLSEIDVDIKDIDYIIISHNHKDHIACLEKVLKKSNAFLCVPKLMLEEMQELQNYEKIIFFEEDLALEDITIKSFLFTIVLSGEENPSTVTVLAKPKIAVVIRDNAIFFILFPFLLFIEKNIHNK